MYQRILVPTDGSEGSAHVAMQAYDLAERYDATVHLLHVVDRGLRGIVGDEGPDDELHAIGRRALDALDGLADTYALSVRTDLREGEPVTEILEGAREVDADLIVMGTHGRSGLERRLIGSVAESVVRRAERPVLTVRLPETDDTVTDEGTAADIAATALADRGHDARVDAAERQSSVWVVEATADGDAFTVYVDPVTRRTSAVPRAADA